MNFMFRACLDSIQVFAYLNCSDYHYNLITVLFVTVWIRLSEISERIQKAENCLDIWALFYLEKHNQTI